MKKKLANLSAFYTQLTKMNAVYESRLELSRFFATLANQIRAQIPTDSVHSKRLTMTEDGFVVFTYCNERRNVYRIFTNLDLAIEYAKTLSVSFHDDNDETLPQQDILFDRRRRNSLYTRVAIIALKLTNERSEV